MRHQKTDNKIVDDFFEFLDEHGRPYAEGFNLEGNVEECLAAVLAAIAYVKFPHDVLSKRKKDDVLELAIIYTILSRRNIINDPSIIAGMYLAHLKSRWQKNQYRRQKKIQLPPEEMRRIMSQSAALPGEVALLFRVEKRQVRLWIEMGHLKKGPDGRIPRTDYLRFSKEFSLKKYGRENYGDVYTEFTKIKILEDRRGQFSQFKFTVPDAPTGKSKSKPAAKTAKTKRRKK